MSRVIQILVATAVAAILAAPFALGWVAYRKLARAERLLPGAPTQLLAWAWAWSTVYRVPWSLVVSILRLEGAYVPGTYGAHAGAYPLGDVTDPRGPALGPGQVMRFNVERLHPDWRPLHLQLVSETRRSTRVMVEVLREALTEALVAGEGMQGAARRYNGRGAAARAYAARAADVISAYQEVS